MTVFPFLPEYALFGAYCPYIAARWIGLGPGDFFNLER
jgi:hypothetical protein